MGNGADVAKDDKMLILKEKELKWKKTKQKVIGE